MPTLPSAHPAHPSHPAYGVSYSRSYVGTLPTLALAALRAAHVAATTGEYLTELLASDAASARTLPTVRRAAHVGTVPTLPTCGDCGERPTVPTCGERCAACFAAHVGAATVARALRAN